jgi:hypothetical protein
MRRTGAAALERGGQFVRPGSNETRGDDMMSRRNLLLAGIGLAGIAAFARNLFAPGRV